MRTLKTSIKIFLLLTLLTGVAYPLAITGIAQFLFHDKANGSLLEVNGKTVGSLLIGQQFDSARYFMPRPSAIEYQPLPSGGSNLGLTNLKLKQLVTVREKKFRELNGIDAQAEIPAEMLFSSGSGLDPHISPQAALMQVERIAKVRKFTSTQKKWLLNQISLENNQAQFGILGYNYINILKINVLMDAQNQQIVDKP